MPGAAPRAPALPAAPGTGTGWRQRASCLNLQSPSPSAVTCGRRTDHLPSTSTKWPKHHLLMRLLHQVPNQRSHGAEGICRSRSCSLSATDHEEKHDRLPQSRYVCELLLCFGVIFRCRGVCFLNAANTGLPFPGAERSAADLPAEMPVFA